MCVCVCVCGLGLFFASFSLQSLDADCVRKAARHTVAISGEMLIKCIRSEHDAIIYTSTSRRNI